MDERQNRMLGTVLFGPERTPPTDMIGQVREAAKTHESREHIEAEMPDVEWPAVWKGIEHRLPDVFEIDLQEIVAGALNKADELKKYCDPEKYPANKPVSIPLGERTISSTHHPTLDIVVDGARVDSVEFTIEVQLQLKAAKIELRGGVVHGLATGSATLNASAWLGNLLLLDKTIGEFDLPGHLDLDHGIPLPWSKPQASDEAGTGPALARSTQHQPVEPRNPSGGDRPQEPTTVRRYYVLPAMALLAGFALLSFVLVRQQGGSIVPPPTPTPQTYALDVVTDPPGADIRLPDLDVPYHQGMQLAPGRYELIVTHPGYETHQETIRLRNQDLRRSIRLVRSQLPTLPSEPTAAGPAPIPPEPVPPEPVPPEPMPPEEAPPGTYAVHLTTAPPGAHIEIIGIGDYTPGMRLEPGRYDVRIRKNGYQITYTSIRVGNRPLEKHFVLTESQW